jgi:hypothetical protein
MLKDIIYYILSITITTIVGVTIFFWLSPEDINSNIFSWVIVFIVDLLLIKLIDTIYKKYVW